MSHSVVFVLPALAAGGMERVTLSVAGELARRGYRVSLILEARHGAYLDHVPAGVAVYALERASKLQAYRQFIGALPVTGLEQLARMLSRRANYVPVRRLPALAAYLKNIDADVVFAAHGRIPVLVLWARMIARSSASVGIIEHSTLSRWCEVFRDEPARHRQWVYRCALARRWYPKADALIGVSKGVAADLARIVGLPGHRVHTLYNPVVEVGVAKEPADKKDEISVCPAWFAHGQPPVILAVGRLVREKNFAALIRAFNALRQTRRLRLIILGDGDERNALTQQVAESDYAEDMCLPGWVEDPRPYMARSRVFVLTSLFEGLGLVLVESMGCGCPVVAVDCPSGPAEILEQGRLGPLVPLGDHDALVAGIAEALDHPVDREKLIARAADFSLSSRVDAYETLIEQTLAKPGV